MILSAHQPCYLPWLGYFNKIWNSDLFVWLDDVQFEKGGYINRTKIKTAQGERWLTIPVKMKGHTATRIKDMECSDGAWGFKHAAQLYDVYHKSPYYTVPQSLGVQPTLIQPLMANIYAQLIMFKCTTPTVFHSGLDIEGEKQELIINLCKHYNADAFLFGAKGRDYVDVEYFKSQGIEPLFQDFRCVEYPQQWGGGFVPGLSVIDTIFNCGSEKTLELIKGGYNVR